MKPLIFLRNLLLPGCARINRKPRVGVFLLFTAIVLTGCFQHYFRTNSKNTIDAAAFRKLMVSNKYFILHFKDSIVALTNITLNGETLQAEKATLLPEHRLQLNPEKDKIADSRLVNKRSYRVKKADKEFVLVEVHLYSGETSPQGNTISLPLSAFYRADVYEFDRESTNVNHVFSWLGVTLTAAAITATVAFLIACNCPQVYVNNNGHYEFRSGVYSGAIHSGLERTDYLPLTNIQPVQDAYRLRINNAKEEKQFINQVQLLSVTHPAGVNLLADRHGTIHSYQNPVMPVAATCDERTDILKDVKHTDGSVYSFESAAGENGLSTLDLEFAKPAGTAKTKLLVHAGNSAWSGYLYREFAALFGNGYENWREQQEKNLTPDALQWQINQGLPMKVWVATTRGWKYVDHFALTGNTARRDMIMEIDLAETPPGNVRLRIETVHRFWDLDKVALDFSENAGVQTDLLDPAVAVNSNGDSSTGQLKATDEQYLQLSGNDYLELEFPAHKPPGDLTSSFFLVSRGYYHTLQKFNGKPDAAALLKFKEKSAFDRFSRQKMAGIEEILAKGAIK